MLKSNVFRTLYPYIRRCVSYFSCCLGRSSVVRAFSSGACPNLLRRFILLRRQARVIQFRRIKLEILLLILGAGQLVSIEPPWFGFVKIVSVGFRRRISGVI